ncbi:MAG: hypothetical protein IJD95_06550 [Clostridia bacterium]|nr:hypothetical protein [Clostridia bacterium]
MKKTVIALIVSVLLLLFVSCGANSPDSVTKYVESLTFSDYVNTFFEDDFKAQALSYIKSRFPLFETTDFTQFDFESGGGFEAKSSSDFPIYVYNGYRTSGEYRISSVVFSTKEPLGGLALPCGLSFGDGIADVMQKLSIDVDVINEFTPDSEGGNVMTLYRKEGKLLTLTRTRTTSGVGSYSYELCYRDVFAGENGSEITFSLDFSFNTYRAGLCNFEISKSKTEKLS